MVRDASIWDSGRWEWWGIILELITPYFGTIWSHKTSETLIFLLFFQYFTFGAGVQDFRVRMVHAMPLDIPRPHKYHLK